MRLRVFQTGRSSKAKTMNAIAYACVYQVLAKLIGWHRRNQSGSVIDVHIDGGIRLISIPRPARDRLAVG